MEIVGNEVVETRSSLVLDNGWFTTPYTYANIVYEKGRSDSNVQRGNQTTIPRHIKRQQP